MDITREFIAPIAVGLFIGLLTAYLFTKYGKVNDYVATIFGINNNVLLNSIIIIIIVGSIITLSGMSVVIHDYEYPMKNPLKFFLEILVMGILPTLAILVLYYLRGNKISKNDMIGLGLIAVKFMILHLLLQLSGYYRDIFQ